MHHEGMRARFLSLRSTLEAMATMRGGHDLKMTRGRPRAAADCWMMAGLLGASVDEEVSEARAIDAREGDHARHMICPAR